MLICITGKSGVGKTTVINYLKFKGINSFIMDDYIKELYRVNQPGYNLIGKNFGVKYLNTYEVNTAKLSKLVFNNKDEMKKLEDLIWPFITKKILELNKSGKTIFVELAILMKNPNYWCKFFDRVIIIDRLDALIYSENKFKLFNKKQVRDSIKYCDVINSIHIDNNKSLDELYSKTDNIISFYN